MDHSALLIRYLQKRWSSYDHMLTKTATENQLGAWCPYCSQLATVYMFMQTVALEISVQFSHTTQTISKIFNIETSAFSVFFLDDIIKKNTTFITGMNSLLSKLTKIISLTLQKKRNTQTRIWIQIMSQCRKNLIINFYHCRI